MDIKSGTTLRQYMMEHNLVDEQMTVTMDGQKVTDIASVKDHYLLLVAYDGTYVDVSKADAKEDKKMAGTTFELDGHTYSTNDKGNYFYKDGKRIKKAEWEVAFDAYTDQAADPDPEQEQADAEAEAEAKKAVLDAEMEKLGYTAIESGWNDIRYTSAAHEVMAWNTVEEGLAWVEKQWDAAHEIEERKAKEAEADHQTEETFNKEKTKKKPRKSKDIAFTFNVTEDEQITLTAKQVDFIKHIPDTCFYEHGLDSMPWCDVLADEIGGQFANKPMTVGAMISTLREKNLIYVGVEKSNGKKAKYFGFTNLGKKVAKELGLE